MSRDPKWNDSLAEPPASLKTRNMEHGAETDSGFGMRWLNTVQAIFLYILNQILSLRASKSDLQSLKAEQSRGLAAIALLFTAIGINSVVLILLEFRSNIQAFGLITGFSIIFLYLYWTFITLSWRRHRRHSNYINASIRLLIVQGILWGLFVNHLSSIADLSQQNIVTAIIMALVSTPMLGAPFSAAMAFWLPMVIGATITIWSNHELFDIYLLLCFSGYLAFTFGGIVFINKTLLERSIGRVRLHQQNEMIGLFLRDYEEDSADWIWETDADQRLCRVPMRLARLLHSSCSALDGRKIDAVFGLRKSAHAANRTLASMLEAQAAFRDCTIRLELGGEVRWWCLTGRPIMDDRGRYTGHRGVGSDVTEARLFEERIRRLASYDTLTGLSNRQMFVERLDVDCGNVADLASGHPAFALLLLDLDRFKAVNDEFGHATGDALLVIVGERLRNAVRESDMIARLGGDEFAIILPSGAISDAVEVAERVILELSQTVQIEGAYITAAASVGIALCPKDGSTPQDLLRNADIALYSAKEQGRGTYQLFEPQMIEARQDRSAFQSDLQHAVETEQMHVTYQPIFDISSGEIISIEALLRWDHPSRGVVPPAVFLPLAEECGLILKLGEFVLGRACRAACGWPADICVAVNLSPKQLGQPELANVVKQFLRDADLTPGRLELEITESTWLTSNQQALACLRELREFGVKVVLDDFGAEHSSLSSLQEFQFDGLKINVKFTRDLERSKKSAAIVKTMARLAAEVSMPLTAAGIENAEQIAILRSCAVMRAQGPFLSPPKSQSEVLAMLGRRAETKCLVQ